MLPTLISSNNIILNGMTHMTLAVVRIYWPSHTHTHRERERERERSTPPLSLPPELKSGHV